jgi:hypothetical protein
MSSTLLRWSLSWDPHPSSFCIAAIDVVGTGTQKVRIPGSRISISLGIASLTIKGNWIAATPIPDQTLESRETRLKGKDKELLLALARKIFRWLPEERPSAQDLYEDEFLTQFVPKDQPGAS